MGRYALLDKETGEIIEDEVLIVGKKPYKLDKGYVKVFVTFLKDIVEDKEISGKAIRLLFFMLEECLNYETLVMTVVPEHAMNRLNISRKTYYNWLNTLIKKGIIHRTGERYRYVLKPYSAVKGKMEKARKNTEIEIRIRQPTLFDSQTT
jgi:hypothetical protein